MWQVIVVPLGPITKVEKITTGEKKGTVVWLSVGGQTENTTHTDITTNKMSRATLPSSGFALSYSMGRAVAPPNHGATALQLHAQAMSRRGCARCRWFARLGRRNKRHQIIERGGGALALGGRRFININNNQMEDGVDIRGCIGEEARPGRNVCGEDGCPSFGVGY